MAQPGQRRAATPDTITAAAVIPARWASTRLPGKPLLDRTGKPLIRHVWERVSSARRLAPVIIATDDERILAAARDFGARAVMTRADHPSGTDRVAEVVAGLDAEYVLNVQGDEPEIDPGDLDRLVDRLTASGDDMVTLARPLGPDEGDVFADPHAVKVVFDAAGRALYFSRAPIPHGAEAAGAHLHLGVYGFRRAALERMAAAPPSVLERRERLEQLRALEMGLAIGIVLTTNHALGIDTPDDYARFVARSARSSP